VTEWLLFALLFAQSPAPAPWHFAILGDRTGRGVANVYAEAWREIAASHPDFVVTVGDSIEGMNDAGARAEWEALKPVWPKSLKIYQTPGNHDIWDDYSARLFTKETGDQPSYSFDAANAHFIVLDNSRSDDLDAAQMQFLEQDLERNKGKFPTLIFFHRSFWLIPMKLHMKDLALHTLARRYGVCCVISGHGHQYQSLSKDGILYLEVGSSGANLGGGVQYEDGWFYQYVYATVTGPHIEFEVRELSAPFGQSRIKKLGPAF